jgi:hypothetical protein
MSWAATLAEQNKALSRDKVRPMSDIITEALLEMHFHRAIVEHFTDVFGASFLRLLKPSARQEAWVGFDQGWVSTTLTTTQLFDELRQAIQLQANLVNHFYLGYFLQFKRVQRVTRKTKFMPSGYTPPYLRVELSLKPNRSTGLSQHETLLRLKDVNFAIVCYACAMLFELDEIYEDPDLSHLQCVDVSSSPTGWATNQRHFITFRNETDAIPLWYSEPVPGKAFDFGEWASLDSRLGPGRLSPEQTITLVESATNELRAAIGERQLPLFARGLTEPVNVLPESFTIVEFGTPSDWEKLQAA